MTLIVTESNENISFEYILKHSTRRIYELHPKLLRAKKPITILIFHGYYNEDKKKYIYYRDNYTYKPVTTDLLFNRDSFVYMEYDDEKDMLAKLKSDLSDAEKSERIAMTTTPSYDYVVRVAEDKRFDIESYPGQLGTTYQIINFNLIEVNPNESHNIRSGK